MKYIALAMLLTVMQAPSPVPRKAPNHPARASQTVKQHRQTDQKPAAQPSSGIETVSPNPYQQNGQSITAPNAQESIRVRELPAVSVAKDWMDETAWAFSFALLIVGSFGVRAAFRTLKAIEKQADPMVQQITVARDAANAAKENIVLLIWVGADCLDARRWLRGWLLIGLAVLLDGLASASGMIGCLPWDW